MKTVFLSGDYYHADDRYVHPDNPRIEFKNKHELEDWKYDGETYYYHLHWQETSNYITKALSMESVSMYIDDEDSNHIKCKDEYRRGIAKELPDRIKQDVLAGRCRFMIDHSTEGYWGIRWDFLKYVFSCEYKDIIWISGDWNTLTLNSPVELHYSNWWERACALAYCKHDISISELRTKQLKLVEDRIPRDKMCTYYNRRIRNHRINMMMIMHHNNLLERTNWSWGGEVDGGMNWNNSLKRFHLSPKCMGGFKYEKSYDEVSTWKNLQNGKPTTEDLHYNLVNTLNDDHVLNTNFQFIIETWATAGKTCFLSEKSFKPFMLAQPFITYGDMYTIQALRDQGYNVFDKWINHSYDSEFNPLKRAEMIAEEMKRLQSISSSEWTDMLYDMRDVFHYNLENLKKANYRFSLDI